MEKIFCTKGGCEWLSGSLCSRACPHAKRIDPRDLRLFELLKSSPCGRCVKRYENNCPKKCYVWNAWAADVLEVLRSAYGK